MIDFFKSLYKYLSNKKLNKKKRRIEKRINRFKIGKGRC